MGIKKINPKIRAGDNVEEAMKDFMPRFGHSEDIAIVRAYEDLKHILTLKESADDKRAELMKAKKESKKLVETIK